MDGTGWKLKHMAGVRRAEHHAPMRNLRLEPGDDEISIQKYDVQSVAHAERMDAVYAGQEKALSDL